MPDHSSYFAFLLRLWREQKVGKDVWRASLEDPHTGEQKGFSNLEALFVYLDQQTTSRSAIEHQEEA